jgi:hypothetical protein
MQREVKKCQVPMFSGYGGPAGFCDKDAYGEYIDGPRFRDAWTGQVRRLDGKYDGYALGPCCPMHGGPEKEGPRVFQDGYSEKGHAMYCAVYEDFENLQESPAEFHTQPWTAIELLKKNHPRMTGK